jgi:hypothetical protein
MERRHLIDELAFDIAHPWMEAAQREELTAYAAQGLLSAIEAACEQESPDDGVLQLDRLEIDLGEIEYRNFREESARRLRERLAALLREKRRAAAKDCRTGESWMDQEKADLKKLERFLASGLLPWQEDPAPADAHEKLLARILASSSGAVMLETLRRPADRNALIKRLILQFKPSQLAELVARLNADNPAGALSRLERLRSESVQGGADQVRERAIGERLWRELLERSLEKAPMPLAELFSGLSEWIISQTADDYPAGKLSETGILSGADSKAAAPESTDADERATRRPKSADVSLPPDAAEPLGEIAARLARDPAATPEGRAGLLAAISAWAGRARDWRAFLARVLDDLAAGRNVDLEAAALETAVAPDESPEAAMEGRGGRAGAMAEERSPDAPSAASLPNRDAGRIPCGPASAESPAEARADPVGNGQGRPPAGAPADAPDAPDAPSEVEARSEARPVPADVPASPDATVGARREDFPRPESSDGQAPASRDEAQRAAAPASPSEPAPSPASVAGRAWARLAAGLSEEALRELAALVDPRAARLAATRARALPEGEARRGLWAAALARLSAGGGVEALPGLLDRYAARTFAAEFSDPPDGPARDAAAPAFFEEGAPIPEAGDSPFRRAGAATVERTAQIPAEGKRAARADLSRGAKSALAESPNLSGEPESAASPVEAVHAGPAAGNEESRSAAGASADALDAPREAEETANARSMPRQAGAEDKLVPAPPDEAEPLDEIAARLARDPAATPEGRAGLLAAISAWAGRARDWRAFLARVLDDLAAGRNVDLEAAALETAVAPDESPEAAMEGRGGRAGAMAEERSPDAPSAASLPNRDAGRIPCGPASAESPAEARADPVGNGQGRPQHGVPADAPREAGGGAGARSVPQRFGPEEAPPTPVPADIPASLAATVGAGFEDGHRPESSDGQPFAKHGQTQRAAASASPSEPALPTEGPIYVLNAGQVLAAPYLPRLFSLLGLTADGVFADRPAQERAAHLLQFMVNESVAAPEYQLVLNKLLCGLRTGIPIPGEIDIAEREKEMIEGLIRGMIQNWSAIGNTSVRGFRESFLQREGWLRLKDDAWRLEVLPKPFDMLLDRLPWSFSIVKHAWMERPIHVDWR